MQAVQRSWASAMILGLALKPFSIFGASVPNFPPDPVGEKLYRQYLHHELFPLVLIALAVLAAWLAAKIVHKTSKSH